MRITKQRENFYTAEYKGLKGYGHTHAKALQSLFSGLDEFNIIKFAK